MVPREMMCLGRFFFFEALKTDVVCVEATSACVLPWDRIVSPGSRPVTRASSCSVIRLFE